MIVEASEREVFSLLGTLKNLRLSEMWMISDGKYHINALASGEANMNLLHSEIESASGVDDFRIYELVHSRNQQKQLKKKGIQVLRILSHTPRASARSIANVIRIRVRTAQRIVEKLVANNDIKFTIRIHPNNSEEIGALYEVRSSNCVKGWERETITLSSYDRGIIYLVENIAHQPLTYLHGICGSLKSVPDIGKQIRVLDEVEMVRPQVILKYWFFQSIGAIFLEHKNAFLGQFEPIAGEGCS